MHPKPKIGDFYRCKDREHIILIDTIDENNYVSGVLIHNYIVGEIIFDHYAVRPEQDLADEYIYLGNKFDRNPITLFPVEKEVEKT